MAGAAAIPVWVHVTPVPGGGSGDQIAVVAPVLMAELHLLHGRLRLAAMGNLEGLTMPDGVLNPGAWGEGFEDRRHPHTYTHELVLTGIQPFRPGGADAVSLAFGKGFAPFGTDDPMSRPFVQYPVNHHLAQILERMVAIAAVRIGPLTGEAGLFNGDEPERPAQLPNADRFGDSWSARLTARPAAGVELQGSYAEVASPEHRGGQGLDQVKWSASGRVEVPVGAGTAYGLVEWARTSEGGGVFVYHSFLGEGALHVRGADLAYRFERSERPEEQRLLELFRTVRPLLDNSIVGRSRWTVHTLAVDATLPGRWGSLRAAPFAELSHGRVTSLSPAAFDPAAFYGRDTFWSVAIGVRLGWGMRLHRMGRYGASADPPRPGGLATHDMQ